ncbi:NADH-quinone oxidoreductase subunit L [Acaryochloris thomasi RCC1774]|uniref:NADH-quinone oxidoreductase subunit L n=1 Tax=Acaryochloris thomasi RCC1774 TaxID=1764569 RepID=A0A2W1JIV5_9CYAN|nr:NAD(P)H-quinone oxidoreductase subunit F [Acaryochloris thomasi]PZD73423.1 NADH-quinone oxidoreductase subunit L [Acaryochloris thomasi RCC1774]
MSQALESVQQASLSTVYWIPIYTLLSGMASVFWSPAGFRRTGPRPAGYINIVTAGVGFVHSLLALTAIWGEPAQEISVNWLTVSDLQLILPLEYSSQTIGAISTITGLNILAQLYAVGYLEMDWGWARFYASISLFEAGMCALALFNSLFFSYVILEILTLGTYLLVGIWFNQSLVVTGARDAFLTKRVGDLILLMAVVALWPLAGTWHYGDLATWADQASVAPLTLTLLGLALMSGPLGKCAQFPLHLWLDEAMEGPLPASILRNAVVVGTGAWVLIKVQPVLALSPVASAAVVWVGATTAVGATLVAIAQIDLKRALSYSVSAYMGLVFIAVGTGHTDTALLLMFTYAVSMALLVMSTGTIIWSNITQDVTQMGGVWARRPISGLAFLVGAAGLVGLPPLGGFWALLRLLTDLWTDHPLLVGVVLLVNALTTLSLARLFGLVFMGQPHAMMARSPEVLWPMVVPMTVLSGVVLHVPMILNQASALPDWAMLEKPFVLLLLWSCLLGGGIGGVLYIGKLTPRPIRLFWPQLQKAFANDLYTAEIYRGTIILAVNQVSRLVNWFDRIFVDGAVNGVGLATLFGGQTLKYNNTGAGQFYLLSIVIGVTLLILALAYPLLS